MELLNDFLRTLSDETRDVIWYIFDIGMLAGMACFFPMYYGWKESHPFKEIIKLVGIAILSFTSVIFCALWIETLTNEVILLSGVTYFLPYLLLSSILSARYTKLDVWQSMNFLSLSYALGRAMNFVGCTAIGCCQGRAVLWGVYSSIAEDYVVPVQVFESCAIFILWIVLTKRMKRGYQSSSGKTAAICVFGFGLVNVVSDIFTVIQPKVVYMVSVEGIFAFLTMCAGLVLLYIVDNQKTQETSAVAETCNN